MTPQTTVNPYETQPQLSGDELQKEPPICGATFRIIIGIGSVALVLALLAGIALGVIIAPKVYAANGLTQLLTAVRTSSAEAMNSSPANVGAGGQLAQTAPAAEQPATPSTVEVKQTLEGAQDYARVGLSSAPIQIVVFEDAQCGYCRQFATGALKQLITEYVDTGKAAITYRHLLVIGPESKTIAKAMACSGKQSKFWDYHTKVFAEDAGLIHSSNLTAALAESAGSIGLDKNAFTACLSSTNVEADIQKDIAVAQQLHVLGTPTMYINGKPILAVQSIELLRSTIDAELSQASLN